jgi:hypothetical protein
LPSTRPENAKKPRSESPLHGRFISTLSCNSCSLSDLSSVGIASLGITDEGNHHSDSEDEVVFVGKDPLARSHVSAKKTSAFTQEDTASDWVPDEPDSSFQTNWDHIPRYMRKSKRARQNARREQEALDDEILQDYIENMRETGETLDNDQEFKLRPLALDDCAGPDEDSHPDPDDLYTLPILGARDPNESDESYSSTDIGKDLADHPATESAPIVLNEDSTPTALDGADNLASDVIITSHEVSDIVLGLSHGHALTVHEDIDFSLSRPDKSRSKKGSLANVPQVDDPDIQAVLNKAWQKDRERKKVRKEVRELQRSIGLLGNRQSVPSANATGDTIDLREKYPLRMIKEEVLREIHLFCLSQARQLVFSLPAFDSTLTYNSLSFPPFDDACRQCIHSAVHILGLRSQSSGQKVDRSRHVVVSKAIAGPFPVTGDMLLIMSKRVYRRVFNWSNVSETTSSHGKSKKAKGFSGRINASDLSGPIIRGTTTVSVKHSYRDGEVIGADAPELGTLKKNKGRNMLEKMGWSSGMGLGTVDNKGILEPLQQIAKSSRAGLG